MQPVSKSEIIKMKEMFDKTIRKASTKNLKKKFPGNPHIEEASSAWVSRKQLEKLLNDNNADGLRLYYGCHHESTHKEPHKDVHGLHNVILVATRDKVDPKNPTCENSVDQLSDTAPQKSLAKAAQIESFEGSGGDMLPLCPPRCS